MMEYCLHASSPGGKTGTEQFLEGSSKMGVVMNLKELRSAMSLDFESITRRGFVDECILDLLGRVGGQSRGSS